MSTGLLRGLARRLQRYHSPSLQPHSLVRQAARADINEGLELARSELKWLQEGARQIVEEGDVSSSASKLSQHERKRSISRRLVELVRRRVNDHEPVAYLLGCQPFGPLDLAIRPPTLIPRPETEEWALRLASMVTKRLQRHEDGGPLRLLDLCSGSGCIGLLLAHQARRCHTTLQVTCADVSPQALNLMRENVRRNGLSDASIAMMQADVFTSADMQHLVEDGGPFDVIVCNPPYITVEEYDEELDESVRAWEDRRALVGNATNGIDDGLVFYRRLAELLPLLTGRANIASPSPPLPLIVVEVGKGQAPAVRNIFASSSLVARCETWTDAWDVERVVLAYPHATPPSK